MCGTSVVPLFSDECRVGLLQSMQLPLVLTLCQGRCGRIAPVELGGFGWLALIFVLRMQLVGSCCWLVQPGAAHVGRPTHTLQLHPMWCVDS